MKKEIKEVDFREGQKVIATLKIQDKGQDFLELDVLENGVLLSYSPMFSHGRLSLLGIGALDGMVYHDFQELKNENTFLKKSLKVKGLFIYFYDTGEKKPLPWKAQTLKYSVLGVKKPEKVNRFIKK